MISQQLRDNTASTKNGPRTNSNKEFIISKLKIKNPTISPAAANNLEGKPKRLTQPPQSNQVAISSWMNRKCHLMVLLNTQLVKVSHWFLNPFAIKAAHISIRGCQNRRKSYNKAWLIMIVKLIAPFKKVGTLSL